MSSGSVTSTILIDSEELERFFSPAPGQHEVEIEFDFYYEHPDPSVGWRGGFEMEAAIRPSGRDLLRENIPPEIYRLLETKFEEAIENMKRDAEEDRAAARYDELKQQGRL